MTSYLEIVDQATGYLLTKSYIYDGRASGSTSVPSGGTGRRNRVAVNLSPWATGLEK